jgi:hypothetical protein
MDRSLGVSQWKTMMKVKGLFGEVGLQTLFKNMNTDVVPTPSGEYEFRVNQNPSMVSVFCIEQLDMVSKSSKTDKARAKSLYNINNFWKGCLGNFKEVRQHDVDFQEKYQKVRLEVVKSGEKAAEAAEAASTPAAAMAAAPAAPAAAMAVPVAPVPGMMQTPAQEEELLRQFPDIVPKFIARVIGMGVKASMDGSEALIRLKTAGLKLRPPIDQGFALGHPAYAEVQQNGHIHTALIQLLEEKARNLTDLGALKVIQGQVQNLNSGVLSDVYKSVQESISKKNEEVWRGILEQCCVVISTNNKSNDLMDIVGIAKSLADPNEYSRECVQMANDIADRAFEKVTQLDPDVAEWYMGGGRTRRTKRSRTRRTKRSSRRKRKRTKRVKRSRRKTKRKSHKKSRKTKRVKSRVRSRMRRTYRR